MESLGGLAVTAIIIVVAFGLIVSPARVARSFNWGVLGLIILLCIAAVSGALYAAGGMAFLLLCMFISLFLWLSLASR